MLVPKSSFLILIFIPFILGTTFVIKEGGVEVGRWTEDDGKDTIEVIENDAPVKKETVVLKEPVSSMTSARRSVSTKIEKPEGEIATWRVAGQVVDTISLGGIPSGGFVVFIYGSEIVKLPIKAEGFFRGELPQIEKGGYSVTVEGVSTDYGSQVQLMKSGSFANIPYRQRLQSFNAIPFGTFESMTIYGNTYDMEIGLKPIKLSEKDQKAYNELMFSMNSGR